MFKLIDFFCLVCLLIATLVLICLLCFLWTGDPFYGKGIIIGAIGFMCSLIVIYFLPLK